MAQRDILLSSTSIGVNNTNSNTLSISILKTRLNSPFVLNNSKFKQIVVPMEVTLPRYIFFIYYFIIYYLINYFNYFTYILDLFGYLLVTHFKLMKVKLMVLIIIQLEILIQYVKQILQMIYQKNLIV